MAVVRREQDWLADRLRDGQHLTRRELARDDLRSERLGHLILLAELDGLVSSGRLANGQHTYALVDEWIPPTPAKDRDEAVRELVLRFFTGHGPASVADLARWTPLTKREISSALADLGAALESTEVDDQTLWHAPGAPAQAPMRGTWLVPVFDEVYLTYPVSNFPRTRDHPWRDGAHSFSEAGGGVVVSDLRDVGWWKRKETGRTTRVSVGLSPSLGARARQQAEEQAAALATYTGRTLDLVHA